MPRNLVARAQKKSELRIGTLELKTRASIGFVVGSTLLLLLMACADETTAPRPTDALRMKDSTPRMTSALSSSLSMTDFTTQYIPLTRAYAISDSGIVAGDVGGNNVAAVWIPGEGLRIVGRLDGTTECCSSLNDINSHGEAIGWSSIPGGTIPMRYSVSTSTKFDPGVGGSLFGQGIDEANNFVGGEWPFRALYKPASGPSVNLANGSGISGSYAFDLNASGMIVGDAFVGPSMKAVIWLTPSSPAQSLGTFGGASSRAWQVSNDGEVVGFAQTATGVKHAFLWTQSTGKIDLSTWPNSCLGDSEAYAINNNGVIAGRCNGMPVLWTGTQGMITLPGGSGEATDINNLNQVVGTTLSGGVTIWKFAALPPVARPGGPYTGNEGSSIAFDGSASSDPENAALSYAWSFGDGTTGSGAKPSHTYADNGTFKLKLTVTDPTGLSSTDSTTVSVSNVPPSITSFAGPAVPLAIGATVSVSGTFTDPGTADTHTISIDWDAGGTPTIGSGTITSPGSFSASHVYSAAGVYTVAVTVTDDDSGAASASYQYVVIYNPEGGFVTGGGWFESPAGAYQSAPQLMGRASFGFVSRYQKGKMIPSGETEFQFRAAGLNFQSTSYEWLVIAGRKAQYKGTGTVNGAGDYAFIITSEDGNLTGGDGRDRLRIKIWNRSTDQLVYDNQVGSTDDANAAAVIAGGSIVIHQ